MLPNALTALRLVATPFIVMAILGERYRTALGVFLLAGITDGLDGVVARKLGGVTRLGAYLDPVADGRLSGAGGQVAGALVAGGRGADPRSADSGRRRGAAGRRQGGELSAIRLGKGGDNGPCSDDRYAAGVEIERLDLGGTASRGADLAGGSSHGLERRPLRVAGVAQVTN